MPVSRVKRTVGETRPIDAEFDDLSHDTLESLDTAQSKYLVGSRDGASVLELTVSVLDPDKLQARAAAPTAGYPASAAGDWDAYWWLVFNDGTVEKVPGRGYDQVTIEQPIGTS